MTIQKFEIVKQNYRKNKEIFNAIDKMNIKIVTIDYKEKVEVIVEVLKQMSDFFEKQDNESKFEIIEYKIVKEKFVEI